MPRLHHAGSLSRPRSQASFPLCKDMQAESLQSSTVKSLQSALSDHCELFLNPFVSLLTVRDAFNGLIAVQVCPATELRSMAGGHADPLSQQTSDFLVPSFLVNSRRRWVGRAPAAVQAFQLDCRTNICKSDLRKTSCSAHAIRAKCAAHALA